MGLETCLRRTKYAAGITKVRPMARPHSRWIHSIQYMLLNSSSVIRELRRWNSGEDWYFRNSEAQSASDIGGSEPVTGFHSVMLSLHELAVNCMEYPCL